MRNLQHIIFIWRQRFWQILKSELVYLQDKNIFKAFATSVQIDTNYNQISKNYLHYLSRFFYCLKQ